MFSLALLCAGGSNYAHALDQEAFDKMMDSYLSNDGNVEKVGNALESFFRKKRQQQQCPAADSIGPMRPNSASRPARRSSACTNR